MVFSDLLFVAVLPLTLAVSFISNVPLYTYTPPPLPWSAVLSDAVLPVTLALLCISKVPLLLTYTPPPLFVAVLPLMVPPFMVKVAVVEVVYTPTPPSAPLV